MLPIQVNTNLPWFNTFWYIIRHYTRDYRITLGYSIHLYPHLGRSSGLLGFLLYNLEDNVYEWQKYCLNHVVIICTMEPEYVITHNINYWIIHISTSLKGKHGLRVMLNILKVLKCATKFVILSHCIMLITFYLFNNIMIHYGSFARWATLASYIIPVDWSFFIATNIIPSS